MMFAFCCCGQRRFQQEFADRYFAKVQLWQVFVGSKEQQVHGHYQALLAQQADGGVEANGTVSNGSGLCLKSMSNSNPSEKWSSQIEKVTKPLQNLNCMHFCCGW